MSIRVVDIDDSMPVVEEVAAPGGVASLLLGDDGSTLFFVGPQLEIRRVSMAGGPSTVFGPGPAYTLLAVSPDLDRVSFAQLGDYEIPMTVEEQGGAVLGGAGIWVATPVFFRGPSSKVVFLRKEQGGGGGGLWSLEIQDLASQNTRIVTGDVVQADEPVLDAPDLVLFLTSAAGANGTGEPDEPGSLRVVSAAGGDARLVADDVVRLIQVSHHRVVVEVHDTRPRIDLLPILAP
jgi:hypothetical protein